MKKILLLIMAVLLIVSFAHSQDSNPTVVTATATVEGGAVLTLSDSVISWSIAIPLTQAEEDVFIPMDSPVPPITIDIFGRMVSDGTSHRGQLVLTCDGFTLGGTVVGFPDEMIKFSFTADGDFPAQEIMSPIVGASVDLWTSIGSTFSVHPTLIVSWLNTLARWGGEYVATYTFTVLDVIV